MFQNSVSGIGQLRELPGEIPDLLTHLAAKYRDHLRDLIDRRLEGGQPAPSLEKAYDQARLASFLAFARGYLAANPITENFAAAQNHGVVLTDGSRVVILPGAVADEDRGGATLTTHTIPISGVR